MYSFILSADGGHCFVHCCIPAPRTAPGMKKTEWGMNEWMDTSDGGSLRAEAELTLTGDFPVLGLVPGTGSQLAAPSLSCC